MLASTSALLCLALLSTSLPSAAEGQFLDDEDSSLLQKPLQKQKPRDLTSLGMSVGVAEPPKDDSKAHSPVSMQSTDGREPLVTQETNTTKPDMWELRRQRLSLVADQTQKRLILLATNARLMSQHLASGGSTALEGFFVVLIGMVLLAAVVGLFACGREAYKPGHKPPPKDRQGGTQPRLSARAHPGTAAQGLPVRNLSRQSPRAHFTPRPSAAPSHASLFRPSIPNAQASTLCPDLVAPEGNETVLGVRPDGSTVDFPVFNADLDPVLGIRQQGSTLELYEWSTGRVLASCRLRSPGSEFVSPDGAVKAWMSPEGGEYLLRGLAGTCGTYRIIGQRLHSLVILADTVAAVTEAEAGCCWLKAGPGVDSGLLLLAALAVDRLHGGA